MLKIIKSNNYTIVIGNIALKKVNVFLQKNKYSSYYILCDENTLQYCLPTLMLNCEPLKGAEIIEIESGESNKRIEIVTHCWRTLLENNVDKNTLLINLGGGVISDLGGFIAATYKRGIDFINIPTTLLAMADASVGGKTGIDFAGIKNSIGTITQPKAVFVYPDFLKTLPQRHINNGLAELHKIALINNKTFWNSLKTNTNVLQLIIKSVELKNKIVIKDPFDKGIRKALNFGHTVGHAIEALFLNTEQELLHGEAIVLGMLIESHISFQKKLISKTELNEIETVLNNTFTLAKKLELTTISILELLKHDKKNTSTKLKFALVSKIGSCKIDVQVTPIQIEKAIHYLKSKVDV